MKIFKYKLQETDEQTLKIPIGSKILKVGTQQDNLSEENIYVWVQQSDGLVMRSRKIIIVGTGNEFDSTHMTYIDTVFMKSGLVWHIFEKTN